MSFMEGLKIIGGIFPMSTIEEIINKVDLVN
jgi:hypothetical protein